MLYLSFRNSLIFQAVAEANRVLLIITSSRQPLSRVSQLKYREPALPFEKCYA